MTVAEQERLIVILSWVAWTRGCAEVARDVRLDMVPRDVMRLFLLQMAEALSKAQDELLALIGEGES